jgi:hypothetical protein
MKGDFNEEARRRLNRLRLGATGREPYGKLTDDDEGEIRLAVAADRDTETVIIDFGKDVSWVGMRPEQAEAFGQLLIEKAKEARR